MMHPETLEVYDRKERIIGIIRKREIQSVSFVGESIGERRQEYSSSKKRNCFNCGRAKHWGNHVEAEDVSSASQSMIQVFVTRIRIDHPVTTELC